MQGKPAKGLRRGLAGGLQEFVARYPKFPAPQRETRPARSNTPDDHPPPRPTHPGSGNWRAGNQFLTTSRRPARTIVKSVAFFRRWALVGRKSGPAALIRRPIACIMRCARARWPREKSQGRRPWLLHRRLWPRREGAGWRRQPGAALADWQKYLSIRRLRGGPTRRKSPSRRASCTDAERTLANNPRRLFEKK